MKSATNLKVQLFLTCCLLCSVFASAQNLVKGKVYEKSKGEMEYLTGVNVVLMGSQTGAISDSLGNFEFAIQQAFPVKIIFSYVGYKSDTQLVDVGNSMQLRVELKKSIQLKEAIVEGRSSGISISTLTPINTTTIGTGELLKAACCNLSESFETNPVVDVNYTDAVTGAKQIQMLGLDGIYTQIQAENVPLIRGLSAAYGLSFTPGPWIESIQINKGIGSIINGYESITGQLNIELKKPQTAERIFINSYVNHEGREELNIQLASKLKKNVSSELLLHGSMQSKKVDHNGDEFLDQPLYQQLNVYNRWHLGIPNKLEAQIGIRAIYEDRTGGQRNFSYANDYGKPTFYGVGIQNKMAEVFTKTGSIHVSKPYKSFALITSTRIHEQSNYFGLKTYEALQKSFYLNTIYQTIIKDTRHYIRSGISLNYNNYHEKINLLPQDFIEIVPGIYSEYTFNNLESFSLVAGIREDFHNKFGAFFTPRIHAKYNFNQLSSLRISAGRGWRTARVFAENNGVFASARNITVDADLTPEVAWNTGINFTKKFKMFRREAVFNADYYYTFFENQVVLNMEDVHEVHFSNLDGQSYAHYIQAELTVEPVSGLVVLLSYKRNEAKTSYDGVLKQRPFLAKDKALMNIEYKTIDKKWSMNATGKLFGYIRIPSGGVVHHGEEIPVRSDPYALFSAQITRFFARADVYLGSENIGNYTQHDPIIDAEHPFGNVFDATLVWGPLMGRIVYLGFRWKPSIKK